MLQDKRVFVIGGGPSAANVDFSKLALKGHVIAVNDSYKKLPHVDELFTADGSWLKKRVKDLKAFPGVIVAALPSFMPTPKLKRVIRLRRLDGVGLCSASAVHYADNSGFGAVAYAVSRGYEEVYMIGFDLTVEGWWHGGYEWKNRIGVKQYPEWIKSFDKLAELYKREGLWGRVYNANPNSGIRSFQFVEINDVLNA